jgi:malonyl-CoA/methylmalonyl-CoA synthetase
LKCLTSDYFGRNGNKKLYSCHAGMNLVSAVEIVKRALLHNDRTAIMEDGHSFSYHELYEQSLRVARFLLAGAGDLEGARVGFLIPPSFSCIAVQWGIWSAGGIAVPLPVMYPKAELDYIVKDCCISAVIAPDTLFDRLPAVDRSYSVAEAALESNEALPRVDKDRSAMILYTSGTTGRSKGVVMTHANIEAQITMLVRAWGWTEKDHTLLVLPLHHVHGLINVVSCALWAGAKCEVPPKFDARKTWLAFSRGDITVFMAVPTIYSKLISEWESAQDKNVLSAGCRKMRLAVSGSAALPVSTLARWQEITGHVIMERYGMTETGMTLSNPLIGERVPGSVGSPLPGVKIRLAGDDGMQVADGEPGEIQVKSAGVFKEYWSRPDATKEVLPPDGWFCTGDIAARQNGVYRILGRKSIDIIKTGGYKVSALEIEEVLRAHPAVSDCAVVGIDDEVWGQKVCAAIIAKTELKTSSLRSWAKERLAPYKVPSEMIVVSDLPRNALGKPVKPEVTKMFYPKTKV